jgi:prevent-host-death family protein
MYSVRVLLEKCVSRFTAIMTIVTRCGEAMKIVTASEFKAKCLQIIDEVAATGEPVVITKGGIPLTQLVPMKRRSKSLLGTFKGSMRITGDIVSPINVKWDAQQ